MSRGSAISTFNYVFDAASQLMNASATGTQMTSTFDNPGRVLTASNSGTSNIPITVQINVYDANSRRTQQTATISGTADYKNTWTFENANRLTQVKQEGQSGGNTVAAKRVDFTWNTGGMHGSAHDKSNHPNLIVLVVPYQNDSQITPNLSINGS